jgi:hypothetical protein
MTLTQIRCAYCSCKNIESYRIYTIKDGEQRTMYYCSSCDSAFSGYPLKAGHRYTRMVSGL